MLAGEQAAVGHGAMGTLCPWTPSVLGLELMCCFLASTAQEPHSCESSQLHSCTSHLWLARSTQAAPPSRYHPLERDSPSPAPGTMEGST